MGTTAETTKENKVDHSNLVADIFNTMKDRVIPENLAGITANFGYIITGKQGGEWTVCVDDGTVEVIEGLNAPKVTTTCKDEDWIAISLGKLDGMTAFTSGRLKVEGNLDILPKAASFFQKYSPPDSAREAYFEAIAENRVDLPNTGIVIEFTIVERDDPHQRAKPPYISAQIQLDGSNPPVAHIVKGVPLSKMETGLKVEAIFKNKATGTITDIDHFRPIQKKAQFDLGYSYDELEVGMSDSFTKTISETDVYLFAGISGDFNPMHLNEEFAKLTPMGTRIAHGALPQCLIAPVLGMKLPGLGTIALEVTTRFKAPTYFGDTITATGEVIEKLEKRKWVKMALTFTNQDMELVATGEALVLPPGPHIAMT